MSPNLQLRGGGTPDPSSDIPLQLEDILDPDCISQTPPPPDIGEGGPPRPHRLEHYGGPKVVSQEHPPSPNVLPQNQYLKETADRLRQKRGNAVEQKLLKSRANRVNRLGSRPSRTSSETRKTPGRKKASVSDDTNLPNLSGRTPAIQQPSEERPALNSAAMPQDMQVGQGLHRSEDAP